MDITTKEAALAVTKWGEERQTNMFIEEMGEFLTAWNHYRRGRITYSEYVEEIADVYIMTQQMMIIHKEEFDKAYPRKLAKVRSKLKEVSDKSLQELAEKIEND